MKEILYNSNTARHGSVALTASDNPANGDTVTVGGVTYTFVSGAPGAATDVPIGADERTTLVALACALAGVPLFNPLCNSGTAHARARAVPASPGVQLAIWSLVLGDTVPVSKNSGVLELSGSQTAGDTLTFDISVSVQDIATAPQPYQLVSIPLMSLAGAQWARAMVLNNANISVSRFVEVNGATDLARVLVPHTLLAALALAGDFRLTHPPIQSSPPVLVGNIWQHSARSELAWTAYWQVHLHRVEYQAVSGTITNGTTATVGSITYTFKSALTPAPWEVLLGADTADSLQHLAEAVNDSAPLSGHYSVPKANPYAMAYADGDEFYACARSASDNSTLLTGALFPTPTVLYEPGWVEADGALALANFALTPEQHLQITSPAPFWRLFDYRLTGFNPAGAVMGQTVRAA
jgi:hypothetical protein